MEQELEQEWELDQEFKEQLEEEIEEIQLSWNKKLILFIIGILSYLIFLLILFPYPALIRFLLTQYVQGIKVDYSHLELSLTSPILAKNLYISNERDFSFSGNQVTLNTSLWYLLNNKTEGNLFINKGNIQIQEVGVSIRNFHFIIDLDHSLKIPFHKWSGKIDMQIKELQLEELIGPLRSFSLPDEQKIAKRIKIYIQMDKGNYSIRKFQFHSLLFDVDLKASGSLTMNISNSSIKGKLCLTPNPELEKLNPLIYSVYLSAGGSLGGKLCLKISGMVSNPKFESL